ncbi:type I-E CRISPR-associated endoribonuclease Cas2e [Streptomyces sp. NPDC058268]|uniref:type I-E CRISPR-associated endoribonuclease Cas2e n=1 Tax=Streptomyces sp. NPDC058268 TaxID=3346413 RepID=UPI0036EB0488
MPASFADQLSRWMSEVVPGIFFGTVTARVRDELWKAVTGTVGDAAAVLVHPAATEQGYTIRTAGTRRRVPVDFDGLTLMRMTAAAQQSTQAKALHRGLKARSESVLPVGVGVFRPRPVLALSSSSAPRRRGSVPEPFAERTVEALCSPPTRGCSDLREDVAELHSCSPPTWGCSVIRLGPRMPDQVLPADARVFRPG